MTKNIKLIAAGAGVAVVATLALAGTTLAHGGDSANRGENRLALTAEQQTTRETEMKAKLAESLTTAVTDGKLTADQQTHIQEVMGQIHTKMEANDLTGADALRDELQTWRTAQGIDQSVMPGHQGEGKGGPGHQGGKGVHTMTTK